MPQRVVVLTPNKVHHNLFGNLLNPPRTHLSTKARFVFSSFLQAMVQMSRGLRTRPLPQHKIKVTCFSPSSSICPFSRTGSTSMICENGVDALIDILDTETLVQNKIQDAGKNTDTHHFCCHSRTNTQRYRNFADCDPLVPINAFDSIFQFYCLLSTSNVLCPSAHHFVSCFFWVLRRKRRGFSLTRTHHQCWCVYDMKNPRTGMLKQVNITSHSHAWKDINVEPLKTVLARPPGIGTTLRQGPR